MLTNIDGQQDIDKVFKDLDAILQEERTVNLSGHILMYALRGIHGDATRKERFNELQKHMMPGIGTA